MPETQFGSGGERTNITCFVDDKPVQVTEQELTVRRLLEIAGANPDESEGNAILRELRAGEHVEHTDLEETIRVEANARFYTGPAEAEETKPAPAENPQSMGGAQPGGTPAKTNPPSGGGPQRQPGGNPPKTQPMGTPPTARPANPPPSSPAEQKSSVPTGQPRAPGPEAKPNVNEGESRDPGSRRSGERKEHKPFEKKTEEQET